MHDQRPNGASPNGRVEGDLFELLGEVVSLPESLVVSPSQGRFHRETLLEGSIVHAGATLGRVAFNGGKGLLVTAPVDGVFLGWLAWDREIIQRGTPLARIGFSENGSNGSRPSNGRGSWDGSGGDDGDL